jgi:toxin YoeB
MGKKHGRSKEGEGDTPQERKKRSLVVDPRCFEDLQYWVGTDTRVLERIFELIKAILREPFTGTGKPEPMKYLGPGTWSRRITGEHRLVYVVFDDRVVLAQARMHY